MKRSEKRLNRMKEKTEQNNSSKKFMQKIIATQPNISKLKIIAINTLTGEKL